MSRTRLRWGLLAAGNIAKAFASAFAQTDSGEVVAVASRKLADAERFGDEFKIPRRYGNYDDLLADPQVDAVYISTPHPLHAVWAIRAAEARKHILCEKPLTMNFYDAMTVIEAARSHGVFLMEAFMYRCNPQTAKIAELMRAGTIGELRLIRSSFGFRAGFNPQSRIFDLELGGGGILDVGCYPVSMARLVAGAARGRDFADPLEVKGTGVLGASGADEWASAVLKFEGGIVAQVSTSVTLNQDNTTTLFGTAGRLHIPSPWFCNGREAGRTTLILELDGKEREEIAVEVPKGIYAIEADVVAASLPALQAKSPSMGWEDSLGNMRTLDLWRKELKLSYPAEEPKAYALPLGGRPLKARAGTQIPKGELPGVGKPIARLVMGVDHPTEVSQATALFDDYFSRGGNCFDTAYGYGPIKESVMGQWIQLRGLREQVVLIVKGAHTPHCNPAALRQQFDESLERLQTNYADIYFLHRDNPQIPVGEFITPLNDLVRAGRLRAFGGSNWSLRRLEEANAWARAHGLQGFSAVSNNLSLARMVDPVWAGCVSAKEPDYFRFHERERFPLFAWSSQARGFFVPERAHPDKKDDGEIVRCWYSEDNFRRQERCFDLARRRSVEPIQIALSWMLHQAFPVFCLIGPRRISETLSSCGAVEISLSPEEIAWLDLRA